MLKRVFLGLAVVAVAISGSGHAMGGKRSDDAAAADPAQRAEAGGRLYNQSCYKCHGPRAVSGGTVPDLRMFGGGEAEFVATALNGRPDTIMPAWKEFLSEDEIKQIYAYVRSQAQQ